MNRPLLFAALLGLLCSAAASAQAPPPETLWLGEFSVAGKSTPMLLHDRSSSAAAPSAIDLPAMMARDVPVTRIAMGATQGSFEFQGGPDRYVFDGARSKGRFSGRLMQGSKAGTFTLVQALPTDAAEAHRLAGSYQVSPTHVIDIGVMDEAGGLLVFIDQKTLREGPLYSLGSGHYVSGPSIGVPYPFVIDIDFTHDERGAVTGLRWNEAGKSQTAEKIAPHRVEEVSVINGDVTLKGSLTLPLGPGPHPAIVFAHGSGDSTRNVGIWNMYFVRLGFAVLSLDKRGAGQSTGDWHTAGMEDIAGDWLAGVEMLKHRADIDDRRIGVHGSSQGGWTAPLMAARSSDIAFIIVRAGSATPVAETMAYEVGWSAREAGRSEAEASEAEAASLQAFKLAGAPWQEFSAYVTPLKAKPWASFAWPLNMSENGWGRPWTTINASYDPAGTLAQVKVPVLWFLADLDHNVPGKRSEQLLHEARARSGNTDFTIVHLPDAGHSFLRTSTGNNSEFVGATHMAANYWDTMGTWLSRRFLQPAAPNSITPSAKAP